MNNLCVDIGWKSINHEGEQLCGDHIEIAKQNDDSQVVVLADGLGSGVKASILSTLTSKIISTMLAEGLKLEDCVETITSTLPICSVRGVAYSTFTIFHIINNDKVEIIQFDNPDVIILRNGEVYDYQKTELTIDGKKIIKSIISLVEGDCLVAMSDGCPHASPSLTYNHSWNLDDITEFLQNIVPLGYNANTLAAMLIDQCDKEYGHHPTDDATACVIKVRKREVVNILIGPPRNRDDSNRMMSLFFSKEGKHIVCGGTTSTIVANYLGKPIKTNMRTETNNIPPIAEIDGVDLATEGVITISKVLEYAKDVLGENKLYEEWSISSRDGAALICRLLFEVATDVDFYVGRAINPAHQNPDMPLTYNYKMKMVDELAECLKSMGKRVMVNYF